MSCPERGVGEEMPVYPPQRVAEMSLCMSSFSRMAPGDASQFGPFGRVLSQRGGRKLCIMRRADASALSHGPALSPASRAPVRTGAALRGHSPFPSPETTRAFGHEQPLC